ncbi:NAD(+)/NADH kinase [Sulfurospirillum arcachonense]|uniref:NAD(+)/NADH kinase n=1 Tax=Sulfurospirillum arcachonense TaxID=57666 RepID=UPI0004680FC2|nr:NAD(+)/NADH kinase [Sulfurospirillum arcachonense]
MKITDTNERLKQIKCVGLVTKPNDTGLTHHYKVIKNALLKYDVKLVVEAKSAKLLNCDGVSFEEMCEQSDFLIALGGDGTLISLSRRSFHYGKPILGVYAGQLGFLTDIKSDEIAIFIDKIFNKDYRIDTRMMLEVSLHVKGEEKKLVAFNDIVFSRTKLSGMAKVEAYIDKVLINTYYGDGLIVSTPTGSTAYNVSAGGPVVYPLTKALILTPVCPHSFTQRPLVLPVNFEVEFKSSTKDTVIIVDGQDTYNMGDFDSVTIKIADNGAKLIHRVDRNYFEVLKEKLHWGQE